ncbi:MAG TPA: MFS transporter, partial [Candidatus Thermoplasmatota archaeon]
TAMILLLFPMVTTLWQVYILQAVLGMFGAMQRTSEKALLADLTDAPQRGRAIGVYHGWVSMASALAVVLAGFLIDLFTLAIIFYIGSVVLLASGFAALMIRENRDPPVASQGA